MRYYEFVAERDMSAMADKLRAMIDHPNTPDHERENAQRALDKMSGRKEKPSAAHKVGADDLQDFGPKTPKSNKGNRKMGSDDLPDFGAYTAKGTQAKRPNRGQQQDFKV